MDRSQTPPNDLTKVALATQTHSHSETSKRPSKSATGDADPTDGSRLKSLKKNEFITLRADLVAGALQARRLASGVVVFYWRYTHNNKTARDRIGVYDSAQPPRSLTPSESGGWSIRAAVAEASARAQLHFCNLDRGGYPAIAAERATAHQQATVTEATTLSFEQLLNQYVQRLKENKQDSWKEVRNALKRHVTGKWTELAAQEANTVTKGQIVKILRVIHQAGKHRQANKIRSYVRAAYEIAIAAQDNPALEEHLTEYEVTVNPVLGIPANTHFNRADKDPLEVNELIKYWHLIKSIEGIRGDALRLHLLSGAPRIAQFVRLASEDITSESFRLEDRKGRPTGQHRPHVLPLTPLTAALVHAISQSAKHALSTDGGKTHIANTTLSNWAQAVVGDEIKNFKLKRVRSGVETLLARFKVDDKTRGHLQSHGIGGVQDKNYNAYDYFDEKREALELLHNVLEPKRTTRSRRSEIKKPTT